MSSKSFYAAKLGFPDFDEDRVAWNTGMEKVMGSVYRGRSGLLLEGADTLNSPDIVDECLMNHRSRLRELCDLQHALSCEAAKAFTHADLEAQWLNSSKAIREKHMLEGLVRTARTDMGLDDSRLHCDELTLTKLHKQGGKPFLELLKSVMTEDLVNAPSTPKLVPNKNFDHLIGKDIRTPTENQRIMQDFFTITRNEFISRFLYNTLASFLGHPFVRPALKKASGKNRVGDDVKAQLKATFGVAETKAMLREDAAAQKEAVAVCENCGKRPEDLKEGQKMRNCEPCKEMKRRVIYCSRSCLKADFKRRHKAICGKPLGLAEATASAKGVPETSAPPTMPWDDDELSLMKIGPAKNGYKRSPALVQQVHYLNSHPEADYIVHIPNTDDSAAVVVSDVLRKVMFREWREAAASGDREAAAGVLEFILYCPQVPLPPGLTRDHVGLQFKNEYGFDVERAVMESRERHRDGLTELDRYRQGYTQYLFHQGGLEQAGQNFLNMVRDARRGVMPSF